MRSTRQEKAGSRKRPSRARYPLPFLVLLALCCLGIAAVLPAGLRLAAAEPLETLLWIFFFGVTNLLVVPILPRGDLDVSMGAPVIIAAVALLPPPQATLISAAGLMNEREFRGETTLAMSVFNRCQIGLSAGAAGWAIHSQDLLGPIGSTVLAVVVYNIVNTLFVSASLWTRGRLALGEAARKSAMPIPRFALDFGLVTMLAIYVVLTYERIGPFAAALLVLPLWLGFSALQSSRKAEDRAEELADRVRELETLNAAATEFPTARTEEHARLVASRALRHALDSADVAVAIDGQPHREGLRVTPVPGADPAALVVPADLSDRQLAVVEAIAGLLGMTLVRQHLEQELAEVQRARAALSGRILEEGTRERSRLAVEIHDDVLPSLAAAQIQADNVRSALSAGALGRADDIARAAHDAAHDALRRLREVLNDIHRQILVPGALRPRLNDALHELKLHHGVEGDLCAPDELPELPHAVEILLHDTVRGCLANIANHANARHVDVRLDVNERAAKLEVRDDGCGFDPAQVDEGHHGLLLMAQRVELARGRFTVDSERGRGTCVQVEVPM